MKYPNSLQELIEYFKLLPGIGEKNAERLAFAVLKFSDEQVEGFSDSLKNEWDLYFDETIEVLGKKCTKAVYKKNRSVVAWFCQEIPSPVGPCGYIGLPGAILRLTTSSEIYEAESILPIKGQVKIELPRGKIMQKPAFEKLQKKKIEELKESGNDNVIVL